MFWFSSCLKGKEVKNLRILDYQEIQLRLVSQQFYVKDYFSAGKLFRFVADT